MSKHYSWIIIVLCCLLIIFISSTIYFYSSSNTENYSLQEKCGKQCEEIFKVKYLGGIYTSGEDFEISKYQNHYNKKMNKCFFFIIKKGNTKDVMNNYIEKKYRRKVLEDVNENKVYGLLSIEDERLTICKVLDKECKSEEEWNLLVKPYMEDDISTSIRLQ